MLPAERRHEIARILEKEGRVHARDLARRLNTSDDTIRRDLLELETGGVLERVHGGALPRSRVPLSHAERRVRDIGSKQAIGHLAASLIADENIVLLDGGTTTIEVARCIGLNFRGTVVTNNLPAALVLADHPGAEIIVLGGRLFKSALDTVGATLVRELDGIRPDITFIGASSLDPVHGLGSLDYDEVQAKRVLVEASSRVVAVLSGEKLATTSPFILAAPNRIAQVITDSSATSEALRRCEEAGISVLVAD